MPFSSLPYTLLRRHAKQRLPLSRKIASVCHSYLLEYHNADTEMTTNGEAWLIDQLAAAGLPLRTIFDVGANKGDWSARLLAAVPTATIHAFEPVPETYQGLVTRLGCERFVPNQLGLSDRPGMLELRNFIGRPDLASVYINAHLPWQENSHIIKINMITGDEYCHHREINEIDLLKIDTEGHDINIIKGFGGMIFNRRISMIQFEYNALIIEARYYLKDFYDFLSKIYYIGRLGPDGVRFKEYNHCDENFMQGNYIAVRCERSDIVDLVKAKRA